MKAGYQNSNKEERRQIYGAEWQTIHPKLDERRNQEGY